MFELEAIAPKVDSCSKRKYDFTILSLAVSSFGFLQMGDSKIFSLSSQKISGWELRR